MKIVTPPQPNKPAQVTPKQDIQKSKITVQPQATLGPTPQIEHIPVVQTTPGKQLKPKMLMKEVPPYPDPIKRPPPRLPDIQEYQRTLTDSDLDMNSDFEGNSPYQEGVISESYQRPDKSYIQKPPYLGNLVDTDRLIQNFCQNRQIQNGYEILEIIQRKVLKGTHLPITVKEIQAGYLTSPYFKDLYLYLAQNKLPSRKNAICKVDALVERYSLLDYYY